jgi:hypothetical protein
LGYRAEMAGVRHAELQLCRARAVLDDQQNAITHTLAEAIAALSASYANIERARQRLEAATEVVEARDTTFEAGRGTIDALLEAQRRLADAQAAYYRAETDHMLAIKQVHVQKGTLLAYNGVRLSEGPACGPMDPYLMQRLAETRSHEIDYRFSEPAPVSLGPFESTIDEPATVSDTVN